MEHYPLKIDQTVLGVWFLGWQQLVGSSLVSLPLSMCCLCEPWLCAWVPQAGI